MLVSLWNSAAARADSRFVTAIGLVLKYHNIDADFWATLRACVETTERPRHEVFSAYWKCAHGRVEWRTDDFSPAQAASFLPVNFAVTECGTSPIAQSSPTVDRDIL